MTEQEYQALLCRKHEEKHFKVTKSWGVYDSYKAVRKHKWYDIGRPLTEHEYYCIVRGVNDYLAQEISKGKTVKFPCKMGTLELRKRKNEVRIDKGKIKVNTPIDWASTLGLWFEDEEAGNLKTLLHFDSDYCYRVRYKPYEADYNNKCFYQFSLNRTVKRALKKNIQEGKTDALW